MENLKFLNKKESERILDLIKEQFGIKKLELDYGILMNREGKIFLISRDVNKIDLSKLRINELGLYVARLDKEIVFPWLNGNDITCDKEFNGFVIIKNKDDFLGTGKFKEGKILNYIPKERRIK